MWLSHKITLTVVTCALLLMLRKHHRTLHRSTLWKAHDIEDPIKLIMVIWVAGLDVFLATVKNWFRRHQFGKDAPDRPDI